MMMNEKPGGHGDRAVAIATMDMALWDAAAKWNRSRCTKCSQDAMATVVPIVQCRFTQRVDITIPGKIPRR